MNCNEATYLLYHFQADSEPAGQLSGLRSHLSTCTGCRFLTKQAGQRLKFQFGNKVICEEFIEELLTV